MNRIGLRLKVCSLLVAGVVGLSAVGMRAALAADDGGASKEVDVSEVMKKAFKSSKQKAGLVKKATDGTASKEELSSLLEYCKQLQNAKPEKGEQKDWDARTAALVSASEKLVNGDHDGAVALKSAANCKECHQRHKPD